jgi:Protein of unknown function (DUF2380)
VKAAAIASILVLARVTIAAADDHNHNVPKVAFFGFQLINTSLEPSTPGDAGRIKLLDDLLRERLDNSGRFKMVPIPPEMQRRIADGPEISGCNGCERGYATTIGADWAAWGTVQKVSNLILNINLYIEDAADGKLIFEATPMSLGGMGSITCCAITCSGSPELHKWVAQGGQWGYKIGRSSGWKLYAWYPVRRRLRIRPPPRARDPKLMARRVVSA